MQPTMTIYLKNRIFSFVFLFFFPFTLVCAQDFVVGQTIQINTGLDAFVGKPSWLLIIRDVDNDRVFPYLYDFRRANNFWLAFTHSRNYLIEASIMQFRTYNRRTNRFRKYKITNFCNLESCGRINRGQSMTVSINGFLSPNPDNYNCQVMRYLGPTFSIDF